MKKITLIWMLTCIPGAIFCQSPGYYPLHVGDRWQFVEDSFGDTTHYYEMRTVEAETLMANGHTYWVSNYGLFGSRFERYSDSKVYIYNQEREEDQLVLDFQGSPGDTIASFPNNGDTTDIILERYTPPSDIGGGYGAEWTFYIDNMRTALDDEQWCRLIDSIGVVENWGFIYHFSLQAAFIDGRTIGTFVGIESDPGLPSETQISRNYPNPFNPSTSLDITVTATAFLRLTIYNVIGQVVYSMAEGRYSPGVYHFTWKPAEQPGGNYFLRIEANNQSYTRKLLYLR
jgi:hypothetical protein